MTNDSDLTLYRINDLVKLLKRCRTSILNDVRAGRFPPPVKLGPRARAWSRSAVMDHLDRLNTAVAAKQ